MNRGLIAVILGGVGYGVYRIATNAGHLQFGNAKLQKTDYTPLVNFTFHFLLPITNPTKTQFPFRGIDGAAWYGKTKLADFQLDTSQQKIVVLGSGKTVNVPILVKVNILTLSSDVQSMIKSGDWLNAAVLKGVVKSDLNFAFQTKIF